MPEGNAGYRIKNFNELNVTAGRSVALKIAEYGLSALGSGEVIKKSIKLSGDNLLVSGKSFKLSPKGRLVIIGVGKCAVPAALALEEILGDRISCGVVLDIRECKDFRNKKIKCIAGSHPMPSDRNIQATREIVEALEGLTREDMVIFIISGGGSTLLCLPAQTGLPESGDSSEVEKKVLEELFRAGASIQEINTVRKHTSLARGGYLAKYAYPAEVVSLIFSDVPGNDMGFIASGPTVLDGTSIDDAEMILAKYNVLNKCNIENCGLVETPKEEKYFERVYNTIVLSNEQVLKEMASFAGGLGFSAKVHEIAMVGEAQNVGERIAREISQSPARSVFLYGGETTVTVRGRGKGGRNQELALGALSELKEGSLILALATDGVDNGPYAGAIADAKTKEKAQSLNLDARGFLDNNDSSAFFEKTGDYILTGPTGSNVSDIIIAVNQ